MQNVVNLILWVQAALLVILDFRIGKEPFDQLFLFKAFLWNIALCQEGRSDISAHRAMKRVAGLRVILLQGASEFEKID